jgi:hypothetical protein
MPARVSPTERIRGETDALFAEDRRARPGGDVEQVHRQPHLRIAAR